MGTNEGRSTAMRLSVLLTIPTLLLGGCASDRADGGFGDVLAGVTGAVGAATAVVGIRGGNAQVTQQGINAMQQAAAVAARDTAPPRSETAGGGTGGSEGDLDAIGRQCAARAERLYPAGPQNQSLMSAACIYHCAHVATGIARYQTLYQESQRRANGLCSVTVSPTCNDISTAACRI